MRIALITIHFSTNYGAVLQAYATQTVLSKFGDVTIIDYDNKFLARQMRLLRFDSSIHGLLKLVHDLLRVPSRYRLLKKFKYFFKHKFFLSRKLNSISLFNGEAGVFDFYICGSDQIWNPDVVEESGSIDKVYFLGFAPEGSKKISYASSAGHHKFVGDEKDIVFNLLSGFTAVSMREADGVAMVSDILVAKDVSHVLDPTLLLDEEEWCRLMNIDCTPPKDKYILVYTVPRSSLMCKAINFFKNKLGLKVIGIDPMLRPIAPFDIHLRDVGPDEFVGLFARAEFIVTDSFHGACFSVNFCKPFVLVSPGARSNRMASLFNLLGLNHRMVTAESEFSKISASNFDIKESANRLSVYRKISVDFLKNSLRSE